MAFCFASLLCHYAGFRKDPLPRLSVFDVGRLQHTIKSNSQMGLGHIVYISLKRLDNADNEWHTVMLYTGRFDQLDNG